LSYTLFLACIRTIFKLIAYFFDAATSQAQGFLRALIFLTYPLPTLAGAPVDACKCPACANALHTKNMSKLDMALVAIPTPINS
jgi:hypothetical protein